MRSHDGPMATTITKMTPHKFKHDKMTPCCTMTSAITTLTCHDEKERAHK